MKKLLLLISTVFNVLLFSISATAQITNGDFESRNNTPQGRFNIAPVDSYHPYDDLQWWNHTPATGNNQPSYLATDGMGDSNTGTLNAYYQYNYGVNYSFEPHRGKGCVKLLQHDVEGDHGYDNLITERMGAPLLAGHNYQVEYWIKRSVSAKYRTSIALFVTTSLPSFDSYANTLSPSPGNKIVESGDIQDTQNWTRISGIITIPANETTNQWVTVGYSRADQRYDDSLPDPLPVPFNNPSFINYLLDDVSLVDMGLSCTTPSAPVVYQDHSQDGNCVNVAYFGISNFDPSLTYTFTRGFNYPTIIRSTPFNGTFLVKTTGAVDGTFFVTASASCASATSEEIGVTYPCNPSQAARYKTGYPNPASESITTPEGTQRATLLNDRGKAVQEANKSGVLDVQSLPDGLYNLQMMQNGKLINQRIQVKH